MLSHILKDLHVFMLFPFICIRFYLYCVGNGVTFIQRTFKFDSIFRNSTFKFDSIFRNSTFQFDSIFRNSTPLFHPNLYCWVSESNGWKVRANWPSTMSWCKQQYRGWMTGISAQISPVHLPELPWINTASDFWCRELFQQGLFYLEPGHFSARYVLYSWQKHYILFVSRWCFP